MSDPRTAQLFASTPGGRTASGLLPCQGLEEFVREGVIHATHPFEDGQIQPASMDLRLGAKAWRVSASFLPGPKATVRTKIDELKLAELDLTRPQVLETGQVYIVQLQESVKLPHSYFGRANPKSTTGRLDVFVRLLTDHCGEFEFVDSEYAGPLYVEIAPHSFKIVVREGTKLNQLRIIHGLKNSDDVDASDTTVEELDRKERLVFLHDVGATKATIWDGLMLSIDLKGRGDQEIVGFKAKRHGEPIDLSKVGHYDPLQYWEPLRSGKGMTSVVLQPDDFWILASKERVRVPPDFAARLVETDPSYGEFRIHYAGFFDPGFGYGNNDIDGTLSVLEVRSHDVPFQLEDGQVIGRLKYERLLSRPTRVYGTEIGSSYQKQGVALSKQFRKIA